MPNDIETEALPNAIPDAYKAAFNEWWESCGKRHALEFSSLLAQSAFVAGLNDGARATRAIFAGESTADLPDQEQVEKEHA